jgi:AcrR family transcriptional regulator
MSRLRREEARKEIAEEIKTVARQQMSEYGTAGLSLRAIARELNITAPAIYNYYPSLDDLISALIADAFTDLAVSMENAWQNVASCALILKIEAMLFAYRQWAIEYPVDFQLIYGNPIPGYEAPFELTGPLARRPFLGLFELYGQALKSGEMTMPEEYAEIPGSIAAYLETWRVTTGIEIPDMLVCLMMSGWARIHGLVMLELFHHLQPVIGDPEALYAYEVKAFHQRLGLRS